jgi:homocysteine S-methyltransferase
LEELNLTLPARVAEVHRAYVAAGARLIETNSFAANGVKLGRFGLELRVPELNRAAARVAREAAGDEVYVGGSVGPLGAMLKPFGYLTEEAAFELFTEQMEGLLAGGVDLAVIETMSSVSEAAVALAAWRRLTDLPALVSLTALPDGTTKFGDDAGAAFEQLLAAGADVVGLNCNLGPKETYDVVTEVLFTAPWAGGKWWLSVMPNAGYPAQVAGAAVYCATPEYFGEYARLFARLGANVVGGCCGTTPAHTAAMAAALAGETVRAKQVTRPAPPPAPARRVEVPLPAPRLAAKLGREFVVTVEVDPPRGIDYGRALEGAALLKAAGVDAVSVADNPMARVRMSSVALAHLLREEAGIEAVLHFTCRDRNLLGLQSELLGAAALGVGAVLALTGDPAEVGDYPKAKSVFDLDSTGLVRLVAKLRRGVDLADKPIGPAFEMKVGVALNPGKADAAAEYERWREKVAAGADFAVTQPFYEPRVWFDFLEAFGPPPVPVLIGVLPFRSFRHAQFLHNEVPGITVPAAALARMEEAAARGKDAELAAGVAIAREILRRVRDACQGVCVMPPGDRFDIVPEVIS